MNRLLIPPPNDFLASAGKCEESDLIVLLSEIRESSLGQMER